MNYWLEAATTYAVVNHCSLQRFFLVCDGNFTLKSLGSTPAGWPRMTKRRELSFLRFWSKSSNDSNRNLFGRNIFWLMGKLIYRDWKFHTSICWCLRWKSQQTRGPRWRCSGKCSSPSNLLSDWGCRADEGLSGTSAPHACLQDHGRNHSFCKCAADDASNIESQASRDVWLVEMCQLCLLRWDCPEDCLVLIRLCSNQLSPFSSWNFWKWTENIIT